MNTTTSLDSSTLDSSTLRRNSLLFWCTLVIPVGIIGIGINFILNPVGASTAFGIPIHDPAAFPFMWVKGIRDIFSGLVVRSSLQRKDRRTTGILLEEHLPKLLINRAAENNSMMHVIDEHLLDLASNRVRTLSQVTN